MTIQLLDDSRLVELAQTPVRPLWAWLDRAESLRPLLVILSLAPGLIALQRGAWDDWQAVWALRAVDVSTAENWIDWVRCSRMSSTAVFDTQPPLSSWLSGGISRFTTISPYWGSILVAYLSGAAVVVLAFYLVRRLYDERVAWLTALTMAVHPQFLGFSVAPTGEFLGIALLLGALLAFLTHLEVAWGWVSRWLFLAGSLWGLAVLAIGPAAGLMILALLSVMIFGRFRAKLTGPLRAADRRVTRQASESLVGMCLLVATGIPVFAWWIGLQVEFAGPVFVQEFLKGVPAIVSDEQRMYQDEIRQMACRPLQELLLQRTFLAGMTLIGIWFCLTDRRTSRDEPETRYRPLIVAWWGLAWLARLVVALVCWQEAINPRVWEALLLIPECILAAIGLNLLLKRKVSVLLGVIGSAVTIGLGITYLTENIAWGMASAALLVLGILLFALAGGTYATEIHTGRRLQGRLFLQLVMLLLLLGNAAIGLADLQLDDRQVQLKLLNARLSHVPKIGHMCIIADNGRIPPRLMFVFRNRWPDAELVIEKDWRGGWPPPDCATDAGLLVEWSRRESQAYADLGSSWKTTTVGEPIRYRGRKLVGWIVEREPNQPGSFRDDRG